MPHLGLVNGIYYAYGYMGHGVPIGSYLGHEVGQIIAGQRDHSIFMDIKHPRSFITLFDKLYMPIVSAYFRFMDTIR
jgi:glycine/D-amino acid oxidase-like deaminating enzyme